MSNIEDTLRRVIDVQKNQVIILNEEKEELENKLTKKSKELSSCIKFNIFLASVILVLSATIVTIIE